MIEILQKYAKVFGNPDVGDLQEVIDETKAKGSLDPIYWHSGKVHGIELLRDAICDDFEDFISHSSESP